ncbi:DNA polymerase III subunit gamma and tau [Microbacterium sp. 4R-513]|uniref:DNA polymerase III subunit gamma and tau n=1 Tax=Microbacterium sp. 4R-513 TaxID=2567934 RepID=UPI0013E1B24C|nr:DNA polymerase III subunit gamma and tau [Microbacterium sp. 4R-513]QIG39940.1 DNA polymerase III subunit gamma and tau [Microbacterium sp. 4R-513]
MTTALYRRYRPETFGEMIGQSQVTEPLMTALRGDRVGHAYLFSGPRGCGKTTSARILARCLNCAEGPTDVPCGKCDSCIELGRGGGGSLDVVEIDAASHNGVDDARDLRERAIFAPARDRFKIFILDEAHMVTPQGFNALLKLVEEPPDHVKFIFATTEPEKVIGTIRSRTHHYPFRLVPPAAMLAYVQELCETEHVTVESGVLPLVVRAGGGSPRDTLSLLDQLIAGSEGSVVAYERAVALLGYTHAELLDEVVDAFAATDASAAFAAIDRVVQTGQDPRRFVDDLLERLRDLIVVAATGQGAAAVLRGVSAEELARMERQAEGFGSARLSHTADLVIATLDDMTGATSPRLQLELMVARVLAAASASAAAPAVAAGAAPVGAASATAPASAPSRAAAAATPAGGAAPAAPASGAAPAAPTDSPEPELAKRVAGTTPGPLAPSTSAPAVPESALPAPVQPAPSVPSGPVTLQRMKDAWPEVLGRLEDISRSSWLVASAATVVGLRDDVLTLTFQSQSDVAKFKQLSAGAGPSEDLRSAILAVLGIRVKYIAKHDAEGGGAGGPGPSTPPPAAPRAERAPVRAAAPARAAAAPVTEWAVAPIPDAAPSAPVESPTMTAPADSATAPTAGVAQFPIDDDPDEAAAETARLRTATLAPVREGEVLPQTEVEPSIRPDDVDEVDDLEIAASVDTPVPPSIAPPLGVLPQATATPPRGGRPAPGGPQRYGEAVVRQVLGATFIREEPYEPPTRFS